MKPLAIALSVLGFAASLAPASAHAQTVTPQLTTEDLAAHAAELGSVLRFRQLGDAAPLRKRTYDAGVQFASAPVDTTTTSWNVTRFVGRFGIAERADMGVWGGANSQHSAGMAGVDAKILLMRQTPSMPVSVSVRPSFSTLFGGSDVWGASAGVDLSVSRTFGAFAPYGGVAATSSIAAERLMDVDLQRATDGDTLAFAGIAYRWRPLVVAAEVEKGTKVSYALRVGTRF